MEKLKKNLSSKKFQEAVYEVMNAIMDDGEKYAEILPYVFGEDAWKEINFVNESEPRWDSQWDDAEMAEILLNEMWDDDRETAVNTINNLLKA